MQVLVKDFEDESTDMVYPCLLEHVPDHLAPDEKLDIIFATNSNGDFIDGIVLTRWNQNSCHSVGEKLERFFLKRRYRIFHGEVTLRN